MTTLAQALDLHDQKFSVMPVSRGKTPLLSKWKHLQESRASREQVEQWWKEFPDANVAILTGVEVNVVDADTDAAVHWCKENLTHTPWTVTTAKGVHFYYSVEGRKVRTSAGKGIDIRGVGGYVVGPTSIHADGPTYNLHKDEGASCDRYVDLPSLCADDIAKIESYRCTDSSNAQNDEDVLLELSEPPGYEKPASEGGRNNALTQYAGSLLGRGVGYEETLENCKRWNKKNEPPLSDQELTTTVNSVYSLEKKSVKVEGHPL